MSACLSSFTWLRLWLQVVQLLLSSNMCAAMLEPKPSDPNGVSPLHLAAKNGHIDVIRCENPPASFLSPVLILVAEMPLASPGERNEPKMCTALLQIANSGWYRHQQTVGVWNSTASGCTLWEDGGGPLAAGCKSVRLSCPPPVCLTKDNCC